VSCRREEQCLGGGLARSESLNGGEGVVGEKKCFLHDCLTFIF